MKRPPRRCAALDARRAGTEVAAPLAAFVFIALLLIFAPPGAVAQSERARFATDAQVVEAIDLIVAELMQRRDPQSHWEAGLREPNDGRHDGGQTALVVLALLHAGQSPQQPTLRETIEWLAEQDLQGVYSRSIRAAIWAQMPPAFLPRLEADAEWLRQAFSREVDGWSYRLEPTTQRLDNSTTQYGALGLWEAAKRGVNVPPEYWRRLEERFIAEQQESGGWTYGRTGPPRGSMTAAGLTVLYITRDLLHAAVFQELRSDWPGAASLEKGLDWLALSFRPDEHPGYNGYYTYYLYGVERVGLASGLKYFGDADWFATGSAALIDFLTAQPRGEPKRIRANVSTVDLAFGLLFLTRGRAPVVVNKLQAGNLAWNNRPRDAAALARFLSAETEQTLNWQVVPVSSTVDAWLDAPLLYVASQEQLPWAPDSDEAKKLREYVLRGGLIIFAAEGGSRGFARSVEELLAALLPEAEWRDLPQEHDLLRSPHEIDARRFDPRGLSNGVRELALVITGRDVPAVLQATYGEPAAEHDREVYELFSNLTMYASGLEPLPPRLAALHAAPAPQAESPWEMTIGLARHAGRWNPEPVALEQFATWHQRQRGGALAFIPVDPAEAVDPAALPLVMLQGVEAVELEEAALAGLARYLRDGGVVFVQTVGGRGNFARTLEQQFAAALDAPAAFLRDHPLITGEGLPGATDASTVSYTPAAWLRFGSLETRPRLRGIQVDGEVRLIFSSDDLTHALLARPSAAVSGYDADSARNLLGNMLAYIRTQRAGDADAGAPVDAP